MSSVKIASVLTRKDSDTIIATAPDFWETLTDFIDELCKISKKQVKKSDFEILTVGDFIKKYPETNFSKKVKKQWEEAEQKEMVGEK